jgi:hypothetical protein
MAARDPDEGRRRRVFADTRDTMFSQPAREFDPGAREMPADWIVPHATEEAWNRAKGEKVDEQSPCAIVWVER